MKNRWMLIFVVFVLLLMACSSTTTYAKPATKPADSKPAQAEPTTRVPTAAQLTAPPTAAPMAAPTMVPAATAAQPSAAPTEAEPVVAAGDGKALVEDRCTECHGMSKIEKSKKSAAQWKSTVQKMVNKGAELTAEEQQVAIKYLAETYK